MDNVDGKTCVYGLIGHPVEHSFSPVIQNMTAEVLNENIVYVTYHVLPENIDTAIKGAFALNIQGLNVTVPHKESVIKYICSLDETAQKIGAVNTLKYMKNGYKGYNTDIIGMTRTIKKEGIEIKNKNVVILGTGGSSYAATAMAASENAKKVYLINRTRKNADKIYTHINSHYNINIDILSYDEICGINNPDIVIQTTSMGFSNQEGVSPVNLPSFFKKMGFALDIIYTPWETEFLKLAKSFGVKTKNGFDMLVYQGLASYEIWRDVTISKDKEQFILENLKNKYNSGY